MKKFLILAASAALVLSASCSKTEVVASVDDGQHAIGFSNYVPRSISKASGNYVESGSTLPNSTHFGVYGWATENPSTDANRQDQNLYGTTGVTTTAFMTNVDVTYGGDTAGDEGTNNTYSPLRYWPAGDTPDGLSFIAYYPYTSTGLTIPGTSTITVAATAATQDDIMVSNMVTDQYYGATNSLYKGGKDGTVDLKFNHVLTKVSFVFKTDVESGTTVKLTSAKLSGIANSDDLIVSYTAGSTANDGATTIAWNGSASGSANYDVTINGNTPVVSTNEVELSSAESTLVAADKFLMVPQAMTAGTQKITLTWTVTTSGVTTTNTKVIDLYDITKDGLTRDASNGIDWVMNNQVKYIITIGPKPIRFTAAVLDWETETGGFITVI